MGKNYAIERAKFERQQRQQAEQYRKLGMDEEQIQTMYEFDLATFRSDWRYEKHTQGFAASSFGDGTQDESKSALFEKFLVQLSVQPDDGHSREWWVEEIENPQLARALRQLDADGLELLTLYVIECRSQSEIAARFGLSQRAIQTHLQEIEKVLGREIDGLDTILFGGSISKKTFIEGTSDVDALVFLDSAKYKRVSPKELQEDFCKLLQKRFPHTEINKGELAVTIKFSDYEVQLLPALRENGKIRIADREEHGWSSPINVSAFTSKLTKTNKINGNKVVPVIKLAKSLFNRLPKQYQLSGYHVEALAVDAFTTYNSRYTLYDMTKHFLNYSTKRVLSPMNDVTGQSGVIDSYLGDRNSFDRQRLSHYIKDIAGRFSGSDAVSLTKELFG